MVRTFEDADWTPVPDHLRTSLKLYVRQGRIPGDLLRCVLMNDLHEACDYAPASLWAQLPGLVTFIRFHLPAECYGAAEKLANWENVGGLDGLEELATGGAKS